MVIIVVQLGRRTVFAEEEADLRKVKQHVQGHLVHVCPSTGRVRIKRKNF